MQIGCVIREYRKRKNLTQEEVANRLGVTAPAVNKWENGVSYPDITLLAPIARLLDITTDRLLSFQKELTDEEIQEFVRETDTRLKEETFEKVFEWAKGILEKYPNCEQLIWQIAVILDARRMTHAVDDASKYDDDINKWYERALESEEEEIRVRAADSLFGFCLRKEQYEKAETYLRYYSKQNPERKRKQAVIYEKSGRIAEAYKAYEELLFSEYQRICILFHNLYMLAMQEQNLEKARMLVDKNSELTKVFEMGEYREVSGRLELAVADKDEEETLDIMERMLASIDEICGFVKSPLYEHMTFREVNAEFLENLKRNLRKNFQDEEAFHFLKENQRWKKLLNDGKKVSD